MTVFLLCINWFLFKLLILYWNIAGVCDSFRCIAKGLSHTNTGIPSPSNSPPIQAATWPSAEFHVVFFINWILISGATVWQPVLQQRKVFLPSACRDYHLPSLLSSVQSPGSFSPYRPEQLDTGRGTVPCARGEGVADSSRNDLSVTWLHWFLSRAMLFTCTFIHAQSPHQHCASRKRPSIYSNRVGKGIYWVDAFNKLLVNYACLVFVLKG